MLALESVTFQILWAILALQEFPQEFNAIRRILLDLEEFRERWNSAEYIVVM